MKKSELLILLKDNEVVVRDKTGKVFVNKTDLYQQLKYFYRRLKITDLGLGRYLVNGKKGFQIIIEED